MQIIVKPGGMVRCIYSESIPLRILGKVTIRRGSHVEPNADGHWTADLSPVGGPDLGPFVNRSDALKAEQVWLENNWLHPMDGHPTG